MSKYSATDLSALTRTDSATERIDSNNMGTKKK